MLVTLTVVGLGGGLVGASAVAFYLKWHEKSETLGEHSAFKEGLYVGVRRGLIIASDYLTETYSDTDEVAKEILSLGGKDS